jgi:hypothetical protein
MLSNPSAPEEWPAPSYEELQERLRSDSLSSVISWSENTCTITNPKEFKSSILPKVLKIKNFEVFCKVLKKLKIKFRKSSKKISLSFSQEENGNYCKKLHKFIDEIEDRNERLFERIKRVQQKLQHVFKINQKMQKILKQDQNCPEDQDFLEYFTDYKIE